MEAVREAAPPGSQNASPSFADILDVEKTFYVGQFELSKQYPLVEFKYMIGALAFYMVLVMFGYQRAARDAKPMLADGRGLLRIYNAGQVILSGYIAYLTTITYGRRLFNEGYVCQPMAVNISENPELYELETYTCWLFYMSKMVDYMDTIFIIARSKWRQLSFLHTFHHSTMIILTWMATYYFPCGYFLIAAQLNAPVHFIMYFYYLLSSFPSLTPFLWWKNYITTIQLIQFVTGTICTIYCFWGITNGTVSGLSAFFCGIFILYGITLYTLFYAFYRATYNQKKKARREAAAKSD